jgi:hypothetical protein
MNCEKYYNEISGCTVEVEVEVTLRLAVSQSVSLGVEPHLGLMTRYIYYYLTVLLLWAPSLSPGVKRPGREADHSLPASANVKKMWIYASTPPYAFMTYCLIH